MARNDDGREREVRCSFCGKPQEHVERIIAGPNVFICNECVDLCSSIVHNDNLRKARQPWHRSKMVLFRGNQAKS